MRTHEHAFEHGHQAVRSFAFVNFFPIYCSFVRVRMMNERFVIVFVPSSRAHSLCSCVITKYCINQLLDSLFIVAIKQSIKRKSIICCGYMNIPIQSIFETRFSAKRKNLIFLVFLRVHQFVEQSLFSITYNNKNFIVLEFSNCLNKIVSDFHFTQSTIDRITPDQVRYKFHSNYYKPIDKRKNIEFN